MKITLIGPFPPPIGGVGIHLKRLYKNLINDFNFIKIDESPEHKRDIYNIRSLNIFKYFLLIKNCNICHIQSSITVFRILHLIVAKFFLNKPVIVTIHTFRNKSRLETIINKYLLSKSDHRIYINSRIKNKLEFKNKNYDTKEAFIPPDLNSENEIPERIKNIINQKKSQNYKIVVSNAWQLTFYNNKDLYGLDLLIELCQKLKRSDKKVFFIFNVCSLLKNKDLYDKYQNQIINKNIEDMFYLTNIANLSFVKMIHNADLVIRATNTDGDSLSVRESLYYNTPVIASDCVERPYGTILFTSRSVSSLYNKINKFLTNNNPCKKNFSNNNSIEYYKNLYTKLGEKCYK